VIICLDATSIAVIVNVGRYHRSIVRWKRHDVGMHWYSETPAARTRQLTTDLIVVAWALVWFLIGRFVYGVVSALGAPAAPMRTAGDALSARMLDIADRVTGVPLVGDELQTPFAGTASVGTNLTSAANQLESSVDRMALWLSLLTAGTPIVLVVGWYALRRWNGIVTATSLAAYRDRPELQELLALRALTSRTTIELSAVSDDPLGDWRSGDGDVIAALATLELGNSGLRPAPPSTRCERRLSRGGRARPFRRRRN